MRKKENMKEKNLHRLINDVKKGPMNHKTDCNFSMLRTYEDLNMVLA